MVGPGLGGLLIGLAGVGAAYAVDAVSCFAMVAALVGMRPQPPHGAGPPVPCAARSRGAALRAGNQALMGSFAIDLMAMTFGMPRALFPVLAVSVYHAGAEGLACCSRRCRRAPRSRR